ncbi:MAG: hypothetical protein EDS66_10015 [Planctomycetota bacterium]|nr:MAG: hypothetical protein EDS66_10015 [Planctomycetota bacterium]MCQ3921042.1 hypothetical protein [Planctomycetota bacterium]
MPRAGERIATRRLPRPPHDQVELMPTRSNQRANKAQGRRLRSVVLLVALAPALPTKGEIRAFRGEVRATVQGLSTAPDGSFILDEEAYDRTISPTRIDALAELATSDADGRPLAAGRAVSILSDPRASMSGNPGEFALETGSFSNDARIAYQLNASAIEQRDTRFTPADFAFAGPGRIPPDVVSTVFVSAAIVFWSTTAESDLSQTQAELSVVIRDNRAVEPVLSFRRLYVGQADGGVLQIEAEDTGVVGASATARILDLDALRASDADEAAAIAEQADRLGLTTFVVVLIPLQSLAYEYDVELNRDFVLEAEFNLAVTSAPTGTGVAGVMGRPFAGLSDLFEASAAEADGSRIQKSVNSLLDASGGDAAGRPPATPIGCGLLGVETLLAAALTARLMWRSRSDRH